MAQFNAASFLRTKGTVRTTVRTEGITTTLQGMPKTYTVAALAKLAEENTKVKVSLRQVEIVSGVTAKSSATLEGKDASTFIRGICGTEAQTDAAAEETAAA